MIQRSAFFCCASLALPAAKALIAPVMLSAALTEPHGTGASFFATLHQPRGLQLLHAGAHLARDVRAGSNRVGELRRQRLLGFLRAQALGLLLRIEPVRRRAGADHGIAVALAQ